MERSFEITTTKPLEGLHGVVYGAGPLGLFTAFSLAANGATITIAAADPIKRGIGFVNAAGLFEPVASADPRGPRFLMSGIAFCEWAQPDPSWGIEPRRVLFLSEDEAKVEQAWMVQLSSYRRATADELGRRRPFGACFDTYVLQPNIAITAVERELRRLGIDGPKSVTVTSAAAAAKSAARDSRANFFVLALGLGLAEIPDIEHVAGTNAQISAGVGVTIVLPFEGLGLDHVIMDDTDLGYLIPQRTQVIGGGTNYLHQHHDDESRATEPDPGDVELVRAKIEQLWPAAAAYAGEPLVGSRPMRAGGHVLTARLEDSDLAVPGLVVGGAGGSGWTFAVGIADDAAAEIGKLFGRPPTTPLVPFKL